MKSVKCFIRNVISLLIVVSLLVTPVWADEQSDLEDRNAQLESQLEQERQKVAEIQSNIDDIQVYIEELQNELIRIEGIIGEYQSEREAKQTVVEELQATVEQLKEKIAEDEAEIERQYGLMKLRIRFMYENVGTSYIESVFSAGSFSEAVEKIQYFLEMSSYDRRVCEKVKGMLDQVEAEKAEVETQITVIEGELAEIDQLQAAEEAQADLYAETQAIQEAELAKQETQLEDAQGVVDAYNAEIEANKDRINTLIAEYEAEQERLRQEREEAENNGGDGGDGGDSGDYTYSSGYIWPLSGYHTITSYFGYRDDPDVVSIPGASYYHQGIDIYAPAGTPIQAIADGVVVSAYWSNEIGYVVVVYHGGGVFSEAHHMCQSAVVYVGESVYQGQTLGYVGSTGIYSTGDHLHFGISVGSDAYALASFVNPLNYY